MLRVLKLAALTLAVNFAFADEMKTDHLPVKYKEAQDIMAKKKIDGKAKHWIIPQIILPPNKLPKDTKAKPVIQKRDDKPKVEEEEGESSQPLNSNLYQPPPPREANEPMVEYVAQTRRNK
jgi:hypothetical protein